MKIKIILISMTLWLTHCAGQGEYNYERLLRRPGTIYHHVPVGLCEDYPEETTTLEIIRNDLEFFKRSQIDLLRISFGWDAIEYEKGKFDWHFWDDYVRMAVEDYHITLIPYICYTPKWNSACGQDTINFWHYPPKDYDAFGSFMRQLVKRYGKWIKSWELWNEPDIGAYWQGSTEEFARLVKIGSRAVRETDPKAIVVLAGLAHRTEFTLELFRDFGISPFVDVVNIHNYFETWHPAHVEAITDYVNDIADIVEQYGDGQSIWMAEVGYSTWRVGAKVSDDYTAYYDYEHTPDYQAVDLFKRLALVASTSKIATIAWYELKDLPQAENVIGDNNNRNLGVAYLDYAPKPAASALMFFNQLFSKPYRTITHELTLVTESFSDSRVLGFENQDGSVILVAWLQTSNPGKRGDEKHGQVKDIRHERIDITIPRLISGDITQYDELGNAAEFKQVEKRAKQTILTDIELRGGELVVIRLSL
ncbi:MAG: hypothetical protein EHM72_16275 [Calditrichaeota bacterium]|nr:MAG: hypothetical protein EHM72_16275 [Calditrichota bacterium]